MARKNTFWNNIWKEISEEDEEYGGYIEYKITIPKNRFTRSFNPKDNTKILIIDKTNLKQLKDYLVKNKGGWVPGTRGSKKFKEDFGGIDCSRFWNIDGADPVIDKYHFSFSEEVLIWNYKDVKIEINEKKII